VFTVIVLIKHNFIMWCYRGRPYGWLSCSLKRLISLWHWRKDNSYFAFYHRTILWT